MNDAFCMQASLERTTPSQQLPWLSIATISTRYMYVVHWMTCSLTAVAVDRHGVAFLVFDAIYLQTSSIVNTSFVIPNYALFVYARHSWC